MTDKLTDNDRQRIEQKFEEIIWGPETDPHKKAIMLAEYATLYERQQQANGLKSIENPDHHIKVLKEQIQYMEKEYKELEAERSEVRNKVIEECIELLEDKGFGVNENDDSRERYNSAQIFRLLNSLKTK